VIYQNHDEAGNVIGIGKAQFGSDKLEAEKKSEKQKPIVHYDYLYMEK
jgi:glutamate 5-kinase